MSTIKPSKEVEKIIKLFEGEVEFEDEVIQHLNGKTRHFSSPRLI